LLWREQVGADRILAWKIPEVIPRYYPGGIVGFDKQGRPVFIESGARLDMKGEDVKLALRQYQAW